ncbi:hypothetical protein [Bombilactobacillus bombi]|uniref:hypothetical protein n=1 Tax=Bombilactobacillus bombi TaxID=1303590 RepID=UPI0015E5FE39|nr:hypothetical protein [Bombilactobacillus bombi]MBA1433831.1 hypothetical protein [Bombilactobacillus bombi]
MTWLPAMNMYLSGQLNYALVLLTKGTFNTKKMFTNLQLDDGTMFSGTLMMAMSPRSGRQQAHDLLYQVRVLADKKQQDLSTVLKNNPKITQVLSTQELQTIMTPSIEHIPNVLIKVQKILKLYAQHHPQLQTKGEDSVDK